MENEREKKNNTETMRRKKGTRIVEGKGRKGMT